MGDIWGGLWPVGHCRVRTEIKGLQDHQLFSKHNGICFCLVYFVMLCSTVHCTATLKQRHVGKTSASVAERGRGRKGYFLVTSLPNSICVIFQRKLSSLYHSCTLRFWYESTRKLSISIRGYDLNKIVNFLLHHLHL